MFTQNVYIYKKANPIFSTVEKLGTWYTSRQVRVSNIVVPYTWVWPRLFPWELYYIIHIIITGVHVQRGRKKNSGSTLPCGNITKTFEKEEIC